jgi:pSer/pThr/pTyr-binding forkhead associated (FHA) protein
MGTFAGATNNWINNTPQGFQYQIDNGLTYIRDGLVLYLDAGDSNSYPGTGNTWTDLSGNGNNGTLVNGVGYNSANGGSLIFDGVNDYVSLPNNNSIAFGPGEFTFEFWLLRNTSSFFTILDTRAPLENPVGQLSIFVASNGELQVWENANSRLTGGSTVINTWNHYTLVRDSSNVVTGYINGVSVGTWTTSLNFVLGSAPRIGSTVNDTFYLNGLISNTRIYKGKGLTQQEVQQNFNVFKGRYGL